MTAAFTPDARWVLSASDDGTARAWDWRTGKPVTPPLTITRRPWSVAVIPDGKHAVVGGDLDTLALLDLGNLARPSASLVGLLASLPRRHNGTVLASFRFFSTGTAANGAGKSATD